MTAREIAMALPPDSLRGLNGQEPEPERDPLWHAPLFLLAPARSNSSVVVTMLGQHPSLTGFPELTLFRAERVRRLLEDPPGWRGPATRTKIAGLLRALAQLHDGEQTAESISRAEGWLARRKNWHVASVYDHLLQGVAPRIAIEKSPESSARDDFLSRMATAYPRARFLHLVRHPVTSMRSMHAVWKDLGHWDVAPHLFGQFCLGVWYHQHLRIIDFGSRLPPDRFMRIQSESILNAPMETLPAVCRWLGIDASDEAVDRMCHPEQSPFARIGPNSAAGGQDPSFLRNPVRRKASLPSSFDLPQEWVLDPWSYLAATQLAHRLGYSIS